MIQSFTTIYIYKPQHLKTPFKFFIIIAIAIACALGQCGIGLFQCKITHICLQQPIQKCDGLVDCCAGNITDESDEMECDLVFSPKPPSSIETLEGRSISLLIKLTPLYQSAEFSIYWSRDDEDIGINTNLKFPFEATYVETTKAIIMTYVNPQVIPSDNTNLTISVKDTKRSYEGLCHKKATTKSTVNVNIIVRKRPSVPDIRIYSRSPEYGSSITLSCNVLEGYIRPQIKWLKGTEGNMTEFSTLMLVDIANPHNVLSRMMINTPQRYQGVFIACKSVFDYMNESLFDLSPKYKLWPPSINYTSAEGDLVVTPGTSINLTCQASGFPPPVYSWMYRPYKFARTQVLKQSFFSLSSVELKHSGYYQCHVMNEMGEDTGPMLQIIVPDPSLGFLAAYFSTKVSLISFVVGILALVIVIGLIMFFVYRKVSDILEERNRLMLEEAAAIAAKHQRDLAGGKKRHKGQLNPGADPDLPGAPSGVKRLKAPPAILDSEKPFVSAMDQPQTFANGEAGFFDEHSIDGMPPLPGLELDNFEPVLRGIKRPPGGIKNSVMGQSGTVDNSPMIVVTTEFQYPDDDDALMMMLLKK